MRRAHGLVQALRRISGRKDAIGGVMERPLPARVIRFAPIVLPIFAIALARAMTHSAWAAAHAWLAALLFAWMVADSLILSTIAKAPDRRPGAYAVLGAAATASGIVLLGAAPPVRAAIFAMPPLLAAAGLTLAVFVLWSLGRVTARLVRGASLEQAAAAVLPPALVRFVALETRVMRLALFGWRRAQDVPEGAQAFDYHRYLLPLLYALLVLQAIELGVTHLLLWHWSPTAAWIALAASVGGLLWLIGLAQGFRIHPVLLTDAGLRVRSGVLLDVTVPYAGLRGPVTDFDAAQVKARDTLNQALLSWPNVMLDLAEPLTLRPAIGGERQVRRIALRIDDSAAFLAALDAEIGR